MNKKVMHTPEGVRDIFGRECDKKRYLEKKIEKRMQAYGYEPIETPSFEFQDVFSKEVGSADETQFFRFFDKDGSLLTLRADFTPAIARAVSMYFAQETGPLRICYHGSIFRNNSSYQGRLRETTQIGAEFLNEDSALADAEMIALVVSILRESGLTDFQISLGHADYFLALAQEAELDVKAFEKLRRFFTTQNQFGAEELISGLKLRKDLKQALQAIPTLSGGIEIAKRAKSLTENQKARAACDRLIQIDQLLRAYGADQFVTYDLGMLSEYQYYSGIIFRAFTFGVGDAIIKGGRYNKLLSYFGKDSAAVGFATEVDMLLNALERQHISIPIRDEKTMVLYPSDLEPYAIRFSEENRAEGLDIACIRFEAGKILDDYKNYGLRNHFGGIVYIKSLQEAYAINLGDGSVNRILLPEYMK